jgi:hypothetical protein
MDSNQVLKNVEERTNMENLNKFDIIIARVLTANMLMLST